MPIYGFLESTNKIILNAVGKSSCWSNPKQFINAVQTLLPY